jgi:phospholipase/carboxylesterase
VFLAHKLDDTMIPREYLERTWSYLTVDSGARCYAQLYEGTHGVSPDMLSDLSVWLGEATAS